MDWNIVGEIAKNVVVAALLAGNIGGLGYLLVKRFQTTN
jgi:hypothetical protein